MCTEVESFLSANAASIPPQHRARIREAILKGRTAFAIELTPYHLRPGLRAALEDDYRARVAGQKFTLKKQYLP